MISIEIQHNQMNEYITLKILIHLWSEINNMTILAFV